MTDITKLEVHVVPVGVDETAGQLYQAATEAQRLEYATKRLSAENQVWINKARQTGETLEQIKARYGAAANETNEYQKKVEKVVEVTNNYAETADQATLAIIALQAAQKEYNKETNQAVDALKKIGGVGEESGEHLKTAGGHTAALQRHLITLGREVMGGHFAAIPATLLRMASHAGLLTLAMAAVLGPVIAVAAAIGGLIAAIIQGHHEMVEMNNALEKSGNFAGTTRQQMRDLAGSMADMGSVTIGTAKEIVTALVGSGQIGAMALQKVAELAENYAATTGQSIDKIGPELVKLFADPAKGAEDLNKSMNFLNAAELEHIQHLVRMGQVGQAQLELAEKLSPHLVKHAEHLGTIERAALGAKQAFSEMWDAAMAVGRDPTKKMQLFAEQAKLTAMELSFAAATEQARQTGAGEKSESYGGPSKEALEAQRQLVLSKIAGVQAEEASAKAAAKAIEIQKEGLVLAKAAESAGMGKVRLIEMEIKRNKDLLLLSDKEAGINPEIRQNIQQKIVDLQKESLAAQRAIGADARALADAATASDTKRFTMQSEAASKYYENQLKIGEITKSQNDEIQLALDKSVFAKRRADEEEIIRRGGMTAVQLKAHLDQITFINEEEKARQAEFDTIQAIARARQKSLQASTDAAAQAATTGGTLKSIGDIENQIRNQERLNESMGATVTKIAQLKNAEIDRQIFILEMDRIANEHNEAYIANIDRQIVKLRELQGLIAAGAQKSAILEQADDLAAVWKDAGTSIADSLTKAFGEGGEAIGDMFKLYSDGVTKQMNLDKKFAAQRDKDGKVSAEKERQYQIDTAANSMRTYGDMAGAAAGFFETNSKGYNTMMAISRAFHIAEIALQIASIAPKLMAGAATMFGQSGWGGFAGVAAMMALMAGLGYAGSAGSAGPSGPPVFEQRQAQQGTGTVFGNEGAKSDSIARAIQILRDNSDQELTYQSLMVASLQNIEAAMLGVANIVVKTKGLTSDAGLGLGTSLSGIGSLVNSLGGSFMPFANFRNSILGTSRQSLEDSGIQINPQTVGQARQGFSGQQFADIKTESSALWGLISSSSTSTRLTEMGADLKLQFTKIIDNMATAIEVAAVILGAKAETVRDVLNGLSIDLDKISFKDMEGEEIQAALNAIFSGIGDKMVTAIMSVEGIAALEQFQKIGEGAFETIIRVASGVEVATLVLNRFGIAMIDWKDVTNKQGEVSVEIVRQSIMLHETTGDVLTGVGKIIEGFDGSISDLATIYQKLLDIRDLLRAVGIDTAGLDADMLKGAGGVTALTDGLATFFGEFFTFEEQIAAAWADLGTAFQDILASSPQLADIMATLGITTMPTTRDEFRALVLAIGTATPEARLLTGQVLALAPAFANASQAAAGLVSDFNSIMRRLQSSGGRSGVMNTAGIDAAIEFGKNNAWTAGMTPQQIIAQVRTITAQDYTNYANQKPDSARLINVMLDEWADEMEAASRATGRNAGASNAAASAATALAKSLKDARDQVKDFMKGMLIGSLSPLSPQEQFLQAKKSFEDTYAKAKGGDLKSIQKITGDAQAYLDLGRQLFASSGDYAKLFEDVYNKLGQIADPKHPQTYNDAMLAALPKNGTLASSTDIKDLARSLREYLGAVSSGNKAAIDRQNLVLAKQPAATANAISATKRR